MMFIVLNVLVKAGVLSGILYLIARDEADLDLQKTAIVVSVITLGTLMIDMVFMMSFMSLESLTGLLARIGLRVLASLVFVIIILMKFCWVRFWKAVLATILFFVANALLMVGVQLIVAMLSGPVEAADDSRMGRGQNAFEMVGMIRQMLDADETASQCPLDPEFMAAVSNMAEEAEASLPDVPPPPPPSPVYHLEAHTAAKGEHPTGLRGSDAQLQVLAVVMQNGKRYAMVNDRMVEEGGIVEVETEDGTNRWRVAEIRTEGVIWEPAPEGTQ